MAQYELSASLLLGALAAASAVSLAFSTLGHRGVKLSSVVQDSLSNDPLDLVKSEDVVDGEPIEDAAFWSRVCAKMRNLN